MSDDEYVVLLEEAQAALYDLIMASEPGTGWAFHQAYTATKKSLENYATPTPRQVIEAAQEPSRAWKSAPSHERERIVLEALGDARLTRTEVAQRINDTHPEFHVYDSGPLLDRMLLAGELERVSEAFKGKKRWRYWRNSKLSGPIADLDQALEA